MNERRLKRETARVVAKVLKLMMRYETIGKSEFEAILGRVIEHVHKNTGIDLQVIGQKTQVVARDLPREYGQLSNEVQSWEVLIAYLYLKYLKELGVLER